MLRFRDLSIKGKLSSLVLFNAVGLAVVLGLALWVLHEYRDYLLPQRAVTRVVEPEEIDELTD